MVVVGKTRSAAVSDPSLGLLCITVHPLAAAARHGVAVLYQWRPAMVDSNTKPCTWGQ